MFRKLLLIGVILAVIALPQSGEARLDTGAKFLTFGIGARAVAMGETFVAVADDATAPYWNPAGAAFVKTKAITAMHNNLYPDLYNDMYHDVLSVVQPLDEKSSLGLGINYLHTGNQPITCYNLATEQVETAGELKTSDLSAIASYARLLNPNLAIGTNFKYVSSKLHVVKGTAYAVDLGMLYRMSDLSLGISLENLGTKISFEDDYQADKLPLNLKVGAGYQITDSILLAMDLNKPFYHDSINPSIGVEIQPIESLALRAGWFDKDGGWKGNTYGFGLKVGSLSLDFANFPTGFLGRANRMSVTAGF